MQNIAQTYYVISLFLCGPANSSELAITDLGLMISIPDSAIAICTFGKIFHIKYITLLLAIMANNNTLTKETLAQFYGVLLYKKKDIVAIQERQAERKLGVTIGGNINKITVPPDSELMGKTLADSYELLLELVGYLILIQENLSIDSNPILEEAFRSNKASMDIPFGEIFNLFMCLEEDIIAIQDNLDIVGYTNQEMAEEADKNARSYLQKFEEFHDPLEDDPGVILPKYGEMGVKKIMFTGEGLPLFPKFSPQQLHEIFVKNSASTDQCPCLEQVS
jgi:hypothetical protein